MIRVETYKNGKDGRSGRLQDLSFASTACFRTWVVARGKLVHAKRLLRFGFTYDTRDYLALHALSWALQSLVNQSPEDWRDEVDRFAL